MKTPSIILPLRLNCAVLAAAPLLLFGSAALAEDNNDIVASANAFVLRSSATTDQNEATTLTTKRLNDSNTRIAYTRFDLSTFLASHKLEDVTAAFLRLRYTSSAADTVRVYGLKDANLNGVSDSAWTSSMIWNDQPARTASPNDIPNSSSALPNANTTVVLGSQALTGAGEVDISISLSDFKALLAADSNQQVTLLFHNINNANANWASIGDAANGLVPTLRLVTIGAPPSKVDISWKGSNSTGLETGIWNTTAANWLLNGSQTTFADGLNVGFNDTATTAAVNLTATVAPGAIIMTNSALNYTISGSGIISGPGSISKFGSGTLKINNSGFNDFSGPVYIGEGTLQVGNNDTSGNLGTGTVVNNATLVISRTDDLTIANNIIGSGSVAKATTGTLTLSGGNAYNGLTTVSAGTLLVANNSALGSTTGGTVIAPGATLDIGNPSALQDAVIINENISVGGAGVNGAGAIVNNTATRQLNALKYLTLTADTTVGGAGRWDLRANGGTTGNPSGATLSTGNQPYKLTKVGPSDVNLVSATIDPMLGDIEVREGMLGFEGNITSAGDSSKKLTIFPAATVRLYAITNLFNKQITIEDTGILLNGSGSCTVVGPMTLNGLASLNVGGTSLTLSNNITGSGRIEKTGTAPLTLAGTASHTGGSSLVVGGLILNGTHTGPLSAGVGTFLRGTGTISGQVDMSGSIEPGAAGTAGTLTVGTLNLNGSILNFDLGSSTAPGGGLNDLLQVNGDLSANNDTIVINPLAVLQAGVPYRLINYTGSLLGSGFNPYIAPIGRYSFTIDTSIPHQVNLIVNGGPLKLRWVGTIDSSWSDMGSLNWTTSPSGTVATDSFYLGDAVRFDDTPGVLTDIYVNGPVSPASITNISTANNFSFTGPGPISGATGIFKDGSSTLTLAISNSFTGNVTVQGGVLKLDHSSALGTTNGSTTIASGATLDVASPSLAANGLNLGLEPIFVSGAGVGGNGAIVNSGPNQQQNAMRNVTLTGDTTFGGPGDATATGNPGRWDIRGTGAALSTGGQPLKLTKTGPNYVSMVGVNVDTALGDIDIQQGVLSFETSTTGLGNSSSNLFVRSGATLGFYQLAAPANKKFQLFGSGTNNTLSAFSGSVSQNNITGPMDLTGECWIYVDSGDYMTLSNAVTGSGSLTKVGGGTLRLASLNQFVGATTISTGTVALVGSSTLDHSPAIAIAAGATLDVSGATGGLTLVNAQSLSGDGSVTGTLAAGAGSTVSPGAQIGRLTVSGAVSFGAGSICLITLDPVNGTNDVLASATSIACGGTLEVVNAGGTFAAGQTFKILDAPLISQAFAQTKLPALGDANLRWDWNAATGTLSVVAGVNNTPVNITSTVADGSLTLSWPEDHKGWTLQAQTNSASVGLAGNWVDVPGSAETNRFIVPINPANPAVFYRLILP